MFADIRYALRTFVRSPGFVIVTILVLALGIGANTAIFGVVNAVLIRPLPYDHPERLYSLAEARYGGHSMQVAGPNFRDWRDRAGLFDSMAAYWSGPSSVAGSREPERIDTAAVSAGFFRVMGAHPLLGRVFRPEEERAGGTPVAMIGEAFWKRGFGGAPDVLGKALTVDGKTYTIVGVLPEGFDFPRLAEVWTPTYIDIDGTARSAHNYRVVGRLRPGVSLTAADAQMTAIMQTLERQYPDSNKGLRTRITPLQQQAAAGIRPTLILLLASVGFVLLIACVNVANLLLARAASRRREIAVRTALGAGPRRLLRQLLTESALLSLAGGLLGLLIALWCNASLSALIPAKMMPVSGIPLDSRVLGFALALSLFTGILFGLAPALSALRLDVNEGLKASSRSVAGGGSRLRGGLIVFEIALSFVLLAGAGLTTKSLLALENVDPGFRSQDVTVAELSFPVTVNYDDLMPYVRSGKPLPPEMLDAFRKPVRQYQAVIDRMRSTPGVVDAAATSAIPLLDFGRNGSFDIEGRPDAPGEKEGNWLEYTTVSDSYFQALGIPLRQGRFFHSGDRTNPNLAIINESAARKFWPGRSPIGARIRFPGFELQPPWLTVVGVVGDIRNYNLANEPVMAAYVPMEENPIVSSNMSVVVKAARGVPAAASLRSAIRAVNNQTPIKITSMDAIEDESVATPRLRSLLIGAFAVFALCLAAIGIYGVINNTVSQRVQEIGVRMALGASSSTVLRMLLGQAGRLTLLGLVLGIAASLALVRLLRGFLFGVSPTDPATFVTLALMLGAIGVLAGLAPAWRAARLDPVTALREDF